MEVIRHPYQITKIEELIKGNKYVFVSQDDDPNLPSINNIYYTFGGTFKHNDVILKNHPVSSPGTSIVTVHLDGINGQFNQQVEPTFIYWCKHRSWDLVTTYIGGPPRLGRVRLIVPQGRWIDDPKVYDSVEPASSKGSVDEPEVDMDWEQRAKIRRDDEMAKFFGF